MKKHLLSYLFSFMTLIVACPSSQAQDDKELLAKIDTTTLKGKATIRSRSGCRSRQWGCTCYNCARKTVPNLRKSL